MIKDVVELFDLRPDDRHPDDLSCAERAVHAPQNIATNIMAGNVLFNYCNSILCASAALARMDQTNIVAYAEAHKEARAISAHVTYFNSRTGAITTRGFDDDVSRCINRYRTQREEWIKAEKARLDPQPEGSAIAAEAEVEVAAL